MAIKHQQHIKIQSSKYMNSLFIWNFKASFAGKGIEFQDFREYSPWDDAKYIDWARSSMEGTTIMRRYREDKSTHILAYIDVRESLYFEDGIKKKLLQELIEFLYHATIASGESFGWFIDSKDAVKYIRPMRNPSSLYQIYNFWWKKHKNEDLLDISSLMSPWLKRSIIFVLSDSMNIDEKSFKAVSKKHDLIYIYISSHFEDTLSANGISYLRGIGWSIAIDLSDEDKKSKYIKLRNQTKQEFIIQLQKIGSDCICLNEKSSLKWEFLKLMKKRMNFVR